MKRFGKHDELTNLAVFLISDMAEYINGECVVIDGGQWLRRCRRIQRSGNDSRCEPGSNSKPHAQEIAQEIAPAP